MDSPGHSAQPLWKIPPIKFCILFVMDKRMTGGKSAVLEKACFQRGLQFLLDKGLVISEVVTDAHVQVEALMSMFTFLIHY